ncbi:hypothetical protein DRN67_03205 [Candidatus Micrarchaeota archaeon]|nr:MAG: hypothetical protein DRN67_03205 [Candidatus Micrarchaeota archaeon]
MLEIKGSNREVLEAVEQTRDPELLLKRKVSAVLLAQIMQIVEITKIVCSPAIYKSLPKSAISALEQMGVEIVVEEVKRGRPHMHAREKLRMIAELRGQGYAAPEIARKLNLPLRTVYYHLRKRRL